MRALINTKMAKETLVRYHVLKMFDHLNTFEILGGEINTKSQINIILESLPDSFNQFKLNCNMNKINYIFFELLNALQEEKVLLKVILLLIM